MSEYGEMPIYDDPRKQRLYELQRKHNFDRNPIIDRIIVEIERCNYDLAIEMIVTKLKVVDEENLAKIGKFLMKGDV